MKKKLTLLLSLALIFISCFPLNAKAFTGNVHDAYLRTVLFGEAAIRNTDVLDALNDASELAIDQHGNDSQNILNELREDFGVKGIPKNVSKFNVGHGNLHRNYTHKGWNYNYKENDGEDEAHWSDIRKKILLTTINQKFDFGFWSGKFGHYDDQCDAFGALIYYVHVIGDHISNEQYHSNYQEIPLVKGAGDSGITEELLKYSPILFRHSVNGSQTYDSYISELNDIKSELDHIYYYPSDLTNPDVYEKYYSYAKALMQCLENYVPLLIKKEPFFKKVFY